MYSYQPSHPVWVRGLKPKEWVGYKFLLKSHPVWVRGLKRRRIFHNKGYIKSHPVWVRGLKPLAYLTQRIVTSRTPCGCVD